MAIEYVILFSLVLVGCAFGSFAGASVWRLRARQLAEDVQAGEIVDEAELEMLSPLTKATISSDRSQCLKCGEPLAWYDLLPLLSWLSTRGNCRYCKKPIGAFEPLMEIGTAAVFVASFMFWPLPLEGLEGAILFGIWLVAVVMIAILFAYDFKWFLLPDVVMIPLIGVGAIFGVVRILGADDMTASVLSLSGAVLILSGLYYLLWLVSKGQWVGFGDVKLGLALALLLGSWQLALLTLFLANLIGTIIVIPGMIFGKIGRKAHIPFGPLLIAGMFISLLVGDRLITLYLNTVF